MRPETTGEFFEHVSTPGARWDLLAHRYYRDARLTLIGDPLLCAGQKVALGGTFGQYAGEYLIHTARHRVERASYTTTVELKGI